MTQKEINRIESAIRLIQTSTDVDPWAAKIAVEAMRKQIDHIAESGRMVERTAETAQNVQDEDLISRKAAIEALHTWFRDGFDEDKWWNSTHVLAAIEGLPSAQQGYKWETCFECPLSHGCPKIKGCTNGQAIEYASQIPNDCPLSAQPEQRWIPCSERMPNNYDYQLLTEEVHYTTGKIVRGVLIAYYDDEDDAWMSAEESPEAISYPIAWQPLPEPYRRGDA